MAETVLAWVWAPLALFAICLGLGLLGERAARLSLPNLLLAPFGLALAVCLAMTVFRLGAGAAVATPLAVIAANVGFFLARGELRARLEPGPAGLAALAAYTLYIAPVALSGHWTWAGYNLVNDTSANFIWIDMLVSTGVHTPNASESARTYVEATAGGLGYPLGSHALAAVAQPLSGAPVAAVYQPVIAFGAAMAALGLTWLARGAGLPAKAAPAAGALAIGAALTYRYSLHGGIKEIVVVALLAAAAAFGREAVDQGLRPRSVAPVGVCVAALLHVFGAVSVVFGAGLAVAILGAALLRPERPRIAAVAGASGVGVAVAVLLFLPSLPATVSFGEVAQGSFSTAERSPTEDLGHLLRPIPLEQTAGVWLAKEYRSAVPASAETENALLVAVVVAMALAGMALELVRRRPSAGLLFAATALAAVVVSPRVSAYADSKFLVVLSPALVLLAAIGALGMLGARRRGVRVAGLAAGAAVAVGVIWSAAYGYNAVRLAPPDRVEAMEDAAAHAPGGGLWLVNEWEEYARYFMSDIRANPAFESESPRPAGLRRPLPLFGRYYDLDEQQLGFVTSFPGIIKRRSPAASRPPAPFALLYVNEYYEVWRRRPSPKVAEHLPLQRVNHATAMPSCPAVRRLAARAGPRQRLVAAARAELPSLDTVRAPDRPVGWPPDESNPGLVTPIIPGRVSGEVTLDGGRFRAWMRGSSGRPVSGRVDGREIGKAKHVNTPGQWLELGTVSLSAGSHRLELVRPGGWISPGNGYLGELGPLALEPLEPRPLVEVPARRADELCGKRWDWIELVDGPT
jgi:hypothetical protein